MPEWFWTHHDARLNRVPVFPADNIRDVPYYVRLEAREYHEALRESRMKVAKQHKYFPVITPEF
jgi:hypothetical protein